MFFFSELRDIKSQLLVKLELHDIKSQLRVIKSELTIEIYKITIVSYKVAIGLFIFYSVAEASFH